MTNKQFQVHFSEDDLFHIEGDYCRMYIHVTPSPESGHFVVRSQGIYEIATVDLGFDGNWDIYLRQIVTECQDGDIILVYNKDRMYRCERNGMNYTFRKVTLYTMLKMMQMLKQEFTQELQELRRQLDIKIVDLAEHVDDLIR